MARRALPIAIVLVLAGGGAASAEPSLAKKSWLAAEAPLVAPRKGVAVLALGSVSTDATWPIALAVYGRPALRPKLDDRAARVLAGEPVNDADPEPVKELSALRVKVEGDDAPSRALFAEIARRTNTLALVVVSRPDKDTVARVYDTKDDRLEATHHLAEKTAAPWGPLLTTLEARYAPAPKPKDEPRPVPIAPAPENKAFYRSPWFWGALGAAAAGGVAAWLLTRNSGTTAGTPHVEWATK